MRDAILAAGHKNPGDAGNDFPAQPEIPPHSADCV